MSDENTATVSDGVGYTVDDSPETVAANREALGLIPIPAVDGDSTPASDSRQRIITTSIDNPIPHPDNPRRGDVNAIARSLERFGQVKPIIVQRSTGYVVAGNHTLQAARQLGWQTIKVLIEEMDDQSARAYLIADNVTSDKGAYSKTKLFAMESELISELGGVVTDDEIADLGASIGIEAEWDGDPEFEIDANIQRVEEKYDPLRELQIAIPTSEMESFTDQISRLQEHWGVRTTTETIRRVVNIAYEALPMPEEGFKQAPAASTF